MIGEGDAREIRYQLLGVLLAAEYEEVVVESLSEPPAPDHRPEATALLELIGTLQGTLRATTNLVPAVMANLISAGAPVSGIRLADPESPGESTEFITTDSALEDGRLEEILAYLEELRRLVIAGD